jgi:uncharacterized protein YlxP (DUF503 family)
MHGNSNGEDFSKNDVIALSVLNYSIVRKVCMRKVLIVSHGNDLEFLNIILNLVEECGESGITPEILDMSTVVKSQDAFNRSILKFAHVDSPETIVFQYLKQSGVDVYSANDYIKKGENHFPSNVIEESIDESIRSTLISKSGNEYPVQDRKYRKLSREFKLEAQVTFQVILNIVSSNGPYEEISVVNGRFPYQRAVQQAAIFLKIRSMSFERGTYDHTLQPGLSTRDRYLKSTNYWHEEFPTTNRLIRQEEILRRFQSKDSGFNRVNAQSWLEERRTPLGRGNQFNENWNRSFDSIPYSKKEFIVLFTSSLDEFAELGTEWKEAKWKNQWEAFEYLIPILYEYGFEVFIRVHPNLRNKNKIERRIVRSILKDLQRKFSYLEVAGPSSMVDSYSLVENSLAVIVWNSTIGLESSLMGTPTACLSSCEYDLIADVHRWLSKEAVNVTRLLEGSVDRNKAGIFISGIYLFDKQLIPLLSQTRLNLDQYGRGLPLLANRWAFRGNNRVINLVSILLPRRVLFAVRKKMRILRFYKR